MSELCIRRRPITHPDAALLVEAVQEEYVVRYGGRDDSPVDPDEFAEGAGIFLVGYLGELPVATGAWRWHAVPPELEVPRCAEIKRMYVVPAHQRRGWARAMLTRLEATATAAEAGAMILETGLAQPEAIALYESAGYFPIAGFGYHRDSPLARCFAKLLAPLGQP